EGDGVGQVLRLCQTTQRDGLFQGGAQLRVLLGDLREQRGVGRAGADGIRGDAVAGEFTGEGLGEGDHATLAGGVDGLAGGAHAGGIGTDVDDGSPTLLLHHHACHGLGAVQGAVEVDVDDAVPDVRFDLQEGADLVPAGVVHQDVDAPVLVLRLGDHGVHGGAVGDVHGDTDGVVAQFRGGGTGGLAVEVGVHDGGARGGQALGDDLADSLCRAGDNADASVE